MISLVYFVVVWYIGRCLVHIFEGFVLYLSIRVVSILVLSLHLVRVSLHSRSLVCTCVVVSCCPCIYLLVGIL